MEPPQETQVSGDVHRTPWGRNKPATATPGEPEDAQRSLSEGSRNVSLPWGQRHLDVTPASLQPPERELTHPGLKEQSSQRGGTVFPEPTAKAERDGTSPATHPSLRTGTASDSSRCHARTARRAELGAPFVNARVQLPHVRALPFKQLAVVTTKHGGTNVN